MHSFFDVIIIAFCAVLCGAESFCDMERFGLLREDWLREFLELKNGIPSHDTFRRVMSIIDAKEFEVAFMEFAKTAYALRLRRISIDGKAVAGAEPNAFNRTLQTVNVYDHGSGLAIGQDLAPNAGFGEIGAVLNLLDIFDLRKTLITVDAASSCPRVAHEIKAHKSDYLMPLRDMATSYEAEAELLFDRPAAKEKIAYSHDENHGRVEDRAVLAVDAKLMSKGFRTKYPSAKMLIKIIRVREKENRLMKTRETRSGGKFPYKQETTNIKVQQFERIYISSRQMTPADALAEIRDHWAIENKLHWNLDVAFREDDWHVRDRTAARNLSILRKIAFNIVAREPSKTSKRLKIKSAGWSSDDFEKVLFNPANFLS